jgi:hypothetical protein
MRHRMIRLGRRVVPVHGTVVAYLALVLTSSGVAYAAATIGSEQIIDNSIRSIDLKDGAAVRGIDVVDNSLSGSDIDEHSLNAALFAREDAGVFTGRSGGATDCCTAEFFYAPTGVSVPVPGSGPAADDTVTALFPATALRGRDLAILELDSVSSEGSRTYILRVNDVDTALRCQIISFGTTCTDQTSVAIPAGAQVSLHLIRGNTGGRLGKDVMFAWRVTSP